MSKRALRYLTLGFLLVATICTYAVQVSIKGQITGNCPFPKDVKLNEFRMGDNAKYTAEVNMFGGFNLNIECTEPRQYNLIFTNYQFSLLVVPGQTVYRISLHCDSTSIAFKVEDSPVNEAYSMFRESTKGFVTQSRSRYSGCAIDTCFSTFKKFMGDYNDDVQLIRKLHPGNFVADVICPLALIPESVMQSPKGFKENFLKRKQLGDSLVYHTDYPITLLSLYTVMTAVKDTNEIYDMIDGLYQSSAPNSNASQQMLEMISAYFGYSSITNEMIALAKWVKAHPKQVSNEVFKSKIADIGLSLPGNRAPELNLPDTSGKTTSFSKIAAANKLTLLAVWSPGCSHCREEIPKLFEFYKLHKAEGLEVYSTAIDCTEAEWKEFIANKFTWTNTWQNPEAKQQDIAAYRVTYTPTFVLINRQGVIISRYDDYEKITALIEKELK